MAFRKKTEIENAPQLVEIKRLERGETTLFVLGTSPMVMNRLPKKAREELLLPRRQENRAARETRLKHDPIAEYRESVYRCRSDKEPTLVHVPDNAFKKAMAQAALDIPGAKKAEIGRLVQVINPTVHIYGKPYLYMAVVRQAGINKTPDIRTRAIFPEWGAKVTVRYIRSRIREQDIVNLMDAAGLITGIGDGRTEKGTFNFGSWELVQGNDPRWLAVMKQARAIQQEAMDNPEPVDEDTEEMLAWFGAEIVRREQSDQITKAKKAAVNTNGKRKTPPAAMEATQ